MVVRMRSTKSHTKNRPAHHALVSMKLSKCGNCAEPVRSHTICANCGYYRGMKVLDLVKQTEKKQKREKAKKAKT